MDEARGLALAKLRETLHSVPIHGEGKCRVVFRLVRVVIRRAIDEHIERRFRQTIRHGIRASQVQLPPAEPHQVEWLTRGGVGPPHIGAESARHAQQKDSLALHPLRF